MARPFASQQSQSGLVEVDLLGLGNLSGQGHAGETLELQPRQRADHSLTLTSSSDSDLDIGDERAHLLRDDSDEDEVDDVGPRSKKRGGKKDYGSRNEDKDG